MLDTTTSPPMQTPQGFWPSWYGQVNSWRYEVISVPSNVAPVLRRWHQRIGLFAFLFMAWLGASGFVLNQSAGWGLDAVRTDAGWLMGLYGLTPQPPAQGFISGEYWLAQTSERTLVNGRPLDEFVPSPLGLAVVGGTEPLVFVAAQDRLVILDGAGRKIDELRDFSLPVSAIRRIGEVPGLGVAIQDLDVFITRDGLDWAPLPLGSEVNWSLSRPLNARQRAEALPFARPTVAIEQVLIDAHSGRLFGRYGSWLINGVGLSALFLGLSGAWMYWSVARRRRQRRR